MEGWYHNPEELKVNLRVREILKILIESVWLLSSTFALVCLTKAAAYLREPLNVRTEQWWNDTGQEGRIATPKNAALMPFFHYEHMNSSGTEPRFLWYETRALNDPHEKCFKEIYPKRKKEWRS